MKLMNAALALAVVCTTSAVTVTAADARPRFHMVRECTTMMRHHHRERVCHMVRRGY